MNDVGCRLYPTPTPSCSRQTDIRINSRHKVAWCGAVLYFARFLIISWSNLIASVSLHRGRVSTKLSLSVGPSWSHRPRPRPSYPSLLCIGIRQTYFACALYGWLIESGCTLSFRLHSNSPPILMKRDGAVLSSTPASALASNIHLYCTWYLVPVKCFSSNNKEYSFRFPSATMTCPIATTT